jgi:hypothetical protein
LSREEIAQKGFRSQILLLSYATTKIAIRLKEMNIMSCPIKGHEIKNAR